MEAIVEGLLYVQGDLGLTLWQIEEVLNVDEDTAKRLVYNLKEYYDHAKRGLRISFLGNTIKLTTREEHKEYCRKLLENPNVHTLSQQALEVLAIIAYNEPITRAEIEKLRGVDSSYVMRSLLAKGLIKENGRSDLPGRPILYKTTDDFLDYFGLASKDDLPEIESLNEDEKDVNTDIYTSIYKEGDAYGRENSN